MPTDLFFVSFDHSPPVPEEFAEFSDRFRLANDRIAWAKLEKYADRVFREGERWTAPERADNISRGVEGSRG